MDAAQLLFAASLFSAVTFGFGAYVQVVLGDSFTVPFTENCTEEPARLDLRIGQNSVLPVSVRDEQGVWRPAAGFTDRVHPNSSVHFSHALLNDTGRGYELTCGSRVEIIQVDVVEAVETPVREGRSVTLRCNFSVDSPVESVWWEKNRARALQNCSVSETRHATGFRQFSVTLEKAGPQDAGVYFCYGLVNGFKERGDPAAERLTVTKASPDQTTTAPQPVRTTQKDPEDKGPEVWIIAVIFVFVIIIISLVWRLRRRCCCNISPDGRPPDVEKPLNGAPVPSSPQVNGSAPLNNSAAESRV